MAVSLFGLEEGGVKVIGEVKTGMIGMSMPRLNVEKIVALLPGAFAIMLLGYSVSLSVASVGAQTTGENIDSNQELVALGVSNLGASVSSGFVVCGSLSRGSVIQRAEGRSQVVSVINASLVILTLIFALPLFFKLPGATLSAIVITAMFGLLDFAYLKKLLRINRGEFAYAMAALSGVVLLGIMQGVTLGVIMAVCILIHRVSHPDATVLGRMPHTNTYRDIAAHPEAERVPGLVIMRFNAPIIFPNAGYFATLVRRQIARSEEPIREVLIPALQINQMDSTGAEQLRKMRRMGLPTVSVVSVPVSAAVALSVIGVAALIGIILNLVD